MCSIPVSAYFVPASLGVRPAGLGGAYVAVADDANAVLFNPAGYASLSRIELVSMYSELYAGFNARLYTGELDRTGYHFLATAIPFGAEVGTFGVAWMQLDSLIYTENTYALSYGRRVPMLSLDLGVNIKILQWQVAKNTFTMQNDYYPYSEYGKTGFTADLGVKYYLDENWTMAASVENIIPADMGITRSEIVSMVLRVGAAWRYTLKNTYVDQVLFSGEIDMREDATREIFHPRLGIETYHRNMFLMRAGITGYDASASLGVRYQLPQAPLVLQMDYSYTYPFQMSGTQGSHRLGLKIQWDQLSRTAVRQIPNEIKLPSDLSHGPALTTTPIPEKIIQTVFVEKNRVHEKYKNKIVIGIERTLSNSQQREKTQLFEAVRVFLEKKTGMAIELRELTQESLKAQYHRDEIDVVISYNEYFYGFMKRKTLVPCLIVKKNGKTGFRYYIYSQTNGSLQNRYDLKGKKIGSLEKEIVEYYRTLFYLDIPQFDAVNYFAASITYPSALAAILALQMGSVDALVGREKTYQLDEAAKAGDGFNIHSQLKVIAQSKLIPDCPILIKHEINPKKKEAIQKMVHLFLEESAGDKTVRMLLEYLQIEQLLPFDQEKYRDYLD